MLDFLYLNAAVLLSLTELFYAMPFSHGVDRDYKTPSRIHTPETLARVFFLRVFEDVLKPG